MKRIRVAAGVITDNDKVLISQPLKSIQSSMIQ
jgi:hypothetical protein